MERRNLLEEWGQAFAAQVANCAVGEGNGGLPGPGPSVHHQGHPTWPSAAPTSTLGTTATPFRDLRGVIAFVGIDGNVPKP